MSPSGLEKMKDYKTSHLAETLNQDLGFMFGFFLFVGFGVLLGFF